MPHWLTGWFTVMAAAGAEGRARGRRRAHARAVRRGWMHADRVPGAEPVIRGAGGTVIRGDAWYYTPMDGDDHA